MNDRKKINSSQDLDALKQTCLDKLYPDRVKISVGLASCGLAAGAGKVFDTLRKGIEQRQANIMLSSSGCLGFCRMEPLVTVHQPGKAKRVYANISPDKADALLEAVVKGQDKDDWVLCHLDAEELIVADTTHRFVSTGNGNGSADSITQYHDMPFFKKQQKIVLRNCGFIDSNDIDEYIGRSGYQALVKALSSMKPEDVIDQIKTSGLRGRGGGGFPTGVKWDLCRQAQGDYKYVVCNADEGDPGAYMDRSVLEGDPHSVLEGMLIGGFAVGAAEGIIYIRTEYPLAIEKLNRAIEQARAYGLLGENILNSGFSFDIRLVEGAGAFVCGEETSLIASIEGRPAEPVTRPPFPVQSGLWEKPTNINNVETWANVPVILARGADWYAKIGTDKSKGTKVFSLVGAITNSGLVEVPMGITLNEIIHEIGEGIPNNKQLKAIQTGGPSGGCVPAKFVDMPVDYEKLAEIGSIMGSGGMVVMDEDNCMVDIARYFTSFTREESCGKCTSCRDGLDVALQLLTKMTEGNADASDMDMLDELSQTIKDASQCGLGKTAPNPILSTMKYFEAEYRAHVKDKKCAAGVCKPMFAYEIKAEACKACGKCKPDCPVDAITGEKKVAHAILSEQCTKCGACYDVCPFDAVTKV